MLRNPLITNYSPTRSLVTPDKSCQLNPSTQHHPCVDSAILLRETICLAVLGQNLPRAALLLR